MSEGTDPECALATYGTLAPGRANAHVLDGLAGRWVEGTVRGRLLQEGWGAAMGHPGIVLDDAAPTVPVHVLLSPDLPAHWARLDAFEGEGYRRNPVRVETAEGVVWASIYVLADKRPRSTDESASERGILTVTDIDHIVLNVTDVEASAAWYGRVLGMTREMVAPSSGGPTRISVRFGHQKINLRPVGTSQEEWFTGAAPRAGSDDLCLLTDAAPNAVADHFRACGVEIVTGPTIKAGAMGPIRSVYVRDPDGNLIEVSSYEAKAGLSGPQRAR